MHWGRLMVVEDQPAWAPHLRSKHRLRTAPKRHFVDPSLAVAASARDRPTDGMADLNLLGFSVRVARRPRPARLRAGGRRARSRSTATAAVSEVDAILEAGDGGLDRARGEARARANQATLPRRALTKFAERIDTASCGSPALLGVIVASGYAYRREDGVAVVPVGALGP